MPVEKNTLTAGESFSAFFFSKTSKSMISSNVFYKLKLAVSRHLSISEYKVPGRLMPKFIFCYNIYCSVDDFAFLTEGKFWKTQCL